MSVLSVVVFFFITAIVQTTNEHLKFRNHRKKKQRKIQIAHKKDEQAKKAAPFKLKILLQPQNKKLFEKFVKLLDDIYWPEYPDDFIDMAGDTDYTYAEELEDYEEELEEAIEEENKMYSLYSKHLQTKEIIISDSELSHIVDLYKKINELKY